MIMMALGALRFGMTHESYQTFTRTAGYRWGKLDRIGAAPALQYLGPDGQEITLGGVIYPQFKGGLRQIETMRSLAGTGRALMMVDGLGFVWNRWAITRIQETRSLFLRDGAPRQIDFDITLQSYGGQTALLDSNQK